MDAETWTALGVIVAVIVGILAWWPGQRSANADERMADSAEQSNRMTADAQAREAAARQQSLKAHFRLRNGSFLAGLGHDTNSFHLIAKNTGPHTAEDVRIGLGLPGEDIRVGRYGRTVKVGDEVDFEFARPFQGTEAIFDILLVFQDGTGDRRQTFTIRFFRQGESLWDVEPVTETTPDAP